MHISKIGEDTFVAVAKSTAEVHPIALEFWIFIRVGEIAEAGTHHPDIEFQLTAHTHVKCTLINIFYRSIQVAEIRTRGSKRFILEFVGTIVEVFNIQGKKSTLTSYVFVFSQHIGESSHDAQGVTEAVRVLSGCAYQICRALEQFSWSGISFQVCADRSGVHILHIIQRWRMEGQTKSNGFDGLVQKAKPQRDSLSGCFQGFLGAKIIEIICGVGSVV